MSSAWDWVVPIREKHFGPPLGGEHPFTRLSREAYWDLHTREMARHFPSEVFFDFWNPRDDAEKADKDRIAAALGGEKLEDFWVVRDGDRLVMMGSGHSVDARVYRMWHTNVHPDYRGKGLYSEYVRRMIAYTRELGFRVMTSEHAVSNNAVIIAKLKAGFRIYALEMNAGVGPSLWLRYFHDPIELAAYEYRCGIAAMNDALLGRGVGAAGKLVEQFRAGAPPEGGSG